MTTAQIIAVVLAFLAVIGFARAARWRRECRHWEANATMWHKAWDRDVRDASLSAHDYPRQRSADRPRVPQA